MWLTSFINSEKQSRTPTRGSVSDSSGKSVQIEASTQHRNLKIIAPYGVAYVPPIGEQAVVLPFDGSEACVGVLAASAKDLKRGELMLYSSGGASIVLKNDGTVLINGKQVG